MKFDRREKLDEYQWHNWFAWYPRYINNDSVRAFVWMETIWRRRTHKGWDFTLSG